MAELLPNPTHLKFAFGEGPDSFCHNAFLRSLQQVQAPKLNYYKRSQNKWKRS